MRKLPPLACLRAFEAAARHLSFKEAASELGVTPTAISHQIRLLEETCGQPLFQRRPLALTGAGERLFPVLRDGFDAFVAAITSVDDTEPRPLKVTSPNAFAGRWLVPRLPQWRAAHPSIPLEIIGTDAMLDLRAGEADVAIRYARNMPSDLAATELFRDSYFPVCHADLLARKKIGRAADLLDYPLIHFDWYQDDPDAPTWWRWFATARSIDPRFEALANGITLSFREELHAIDAVRAGQGIAICSDVVVGDELKAGTLVKAHELSLPGYGFYLVHLHGHFRRPIVDVFSSWIRVMN
ncbi:MAG: LysR substrate-binding domain-containing protein [Pseudolabrys sp.]|jgi:LysR family glycine cleavage system transcriptional activator